MRSIALLSLLLVACEPSVARPDTGVPPEQDAGPSGTDAGGRDAGAPSPDAGPGADLGCAGRAAGPSASPRVTLSGSIQRVGGLPEENVLVQLFDAADPTLSTPLDMGTTLADGRFSLDLDLPMMDARPIAVRADPPTGATRRAYVFAPRGINADVTELTIPLYDTPNWNALYMAASASPNAMRGTLRVTAYDCAGARLAGATVELDRLQPDSVVTYLEGGAPSARTSTDPSGEAFVLNAPTGDVTLTVFANAGAVELGSGRFNVRPDRLTYAIWR